MNDQLDISGGPGGDLVFSIGTILATCIFYLQVAPILPAKFRVRRRRAKEILKIAALRAILDF